MIFFKASIFHDEGLLAHRPTPKLKDHSLSAQIANLVQSRLSGRHLHNSQPDYKQCLGDSDQINATLKIIYV